MIFQVSPHEVVIKSQPSRRDVKRQTERLLQEGQIEPILLHEDNTINAANWPYADAQVIAARELEWPTILVTYKDE